MPIKLLIRVGVCDEIDIWLQFPATKNFKTFQVGIDFFEKLGTSPITALVMYSIGLIVVSDLCFKGNSEDLTGPALLEYISRRECYEVGSIKIVPDEIDEIQKAVLDFKKYSLILTAGGTGFGIRDVTPQVCNLITRRLFQLNHVLGY